VIGASRVRCDAPQCPGPLRPRALVVTLGHQALNSTKTDPGETTLNAEEMQQRFMLTVEKQALLRLLEFAKDRDSTQAARVANFLLAWWDPEKYGRFDLLDAWALDEGIRKDLVTVFGLISHVASYPDTLGYREEFVSLVRLYRTGMGE